MIALKRMIKYVKTTTTLVSGTTRTQMMSYLGILRLTGLGMLMIERVH